MSCNYEKKRYDINTSFLTIRNTKGDNKMRNEKRFITDMKAANLVERITYEKWCNHLTVDSYFIPDEVVEQIKCHYPETLVFN